MTRVRLPGAQDAEKKTRGAFLSLIAGLCSVAGLQAAFAIMVCKGFKELERDPEKRRAANEEVRNFMERTESRERLEVTADTSLERASPWRPSGKQVLLAGVFMLGVVGTAIASRTRGRISTLRKRLVDTESSTSQDSSGSLDLKGLSAQITGVMQTAQLSQVFKPKVVKRKQDVSEGSIDFFEAMRMRHQEREDRQKFAFEKAMKEKYGKKR
eukprot:gnl/MRDRNA2_/MRDRNA2_128835_c0_seq1.p1 gnl/MRDRNA2_/MRDRNA2_128835_c0~~gnl/MRDRNA2_/MRDRNA2_128835_c0_seq1.p1  ORF type:complete len:227 (+),score=53.99 gnl/MRDRNA2_/MRDRNA2_128835_c0_seq1:45-683(+)